MYNLKFHKAAEKDFKVIDKNNASRIKAAIIKKLTSNPEVFGERLKHELQNYWKLRVGDYRVIFEIMKDNSIFIYGVMHRREVYEAIVKRKLY